MQILHYTLGFPPYARGGLTKYAIDLMAAQHRSGNKVGMLWPVQMKSGKRSNIIFCGKTGEIGSFKLINPLPLPQIYGIEDTGIFREERDVSRCAEFIEKFKPDVIHIHTLMGMPKELINLFSAKQIRTVYTTHDFFGICPKTILFFNHKNCANNAECIGCPECNCGALTKDKMMILQTGLYRRVKESSIVKMIRKSAKKSKLQSSDQDKTIDPNNKNIQDYMTLREYYISMLHDIKCIHFNSSYVYDVFKRFMTIGDYKILSITNAEISNNITLKTFEKDRKLRLCYVGAIADYKGISLLLEALDSIIQENSGAASLFELHVYGETIVERDYVVQHPPYKYTELKNVMANTDLLCIPRDVSFGFSVIEGMSYGVPVLISEEVGAKDLAQDTVTGLICECTVEGLKEKIIGVIHDREVLSQINQNLVNNFHVQTIDEHCLDVCKALYGGRNH
ncbi:MAG: glycosyltransferase [Oscillospiraceae bacterium]|nr:glycosyltransferase [Oscillospiraceae bacterium]